MFVIYTIEIIFSVYENRLERRIFNIYSKRLTSPVKYFQQETYHIFSPKVHFTNNNADISPTHSHYTHNTFSTHFHLHQKSYDFHHIPYKV